MYKPTVPHNVINFHVFYHDDQILEFMTNAKVFIDATIDEEEHARSLQEEAGLQKGNPLPKGMVILEKLFDLQSCFKDPLNTKTHSSTLSLEKINLGIDSNPKYVNSSKQHKYILISTDYFTLWVEEIPLHKDNKDEVVSVIKHCIIARFSVPTSLVFDNVTYILSLRLYDFALENNIALKHFANYYPQGNGLAKSTTKNLICIIKKTLLSE